MTIRTIRCPAQTCGMRFLNLKGWKAHYRMKHLKFGRYITPGTEIAYPEVRFDTKRKPRRHRVTRRRSCPTCGQKFTYRGWLERHIPKCAGPSAKPPIEWVDSPGLRVSAPPVPTEVLEHRPSRQVHIGKHKVEDLMMGKFLAPGIIRDIDDDTVYISYRRLFDMLYAPLGQPGTEE